MSKEILYTGKMSVDEFADYVGKFKFLVITSQSDYTTIAYFEDKNTEDRMDVSVWSDEGITVEYLGEMRPESKQDSSVYKVSLNGNNIMMVADYSTPADFFKFVDKASYSSYTQMEFVVQNSYGDTLAVSSKSLYNRLTKSQRAQSS